jgi:hypothetical protein
VHGIGQTEMHTAKLSVPDPSASEVEAAVGRLKSYKSPGVDQIPAELIQEGGETLHLEIHKLIKLIWNKEELPHQWKESIVVPIHKKGDKTDCCNCRGISLLPTSYKTLSSILLAGLTPYASEITVDHQCDFSVTDQQLIKFSISGRYWRKNASIMVQYLSYL